ncbi:MAG TPA: hypothetical protein VFA67_01390 [Candidatus Sulfotelmatobacter sp.]|nr:hypothetical protein [Candidatus Sulfotelmatobacter sp.]
MMPGKTHGVLVCLMILVAVPAYCQRGTFGIDVGQSTDKFGAVPSDSGLVVGLDGEIAVLKANQKDGGASIVAGGEIRLPSDTQHHAKEFAIFVGPAFQYRNLTIEVHAQIRKIYTPPSTVNNQVFVRDKIELLEIPLVLRYKFGPAKRTFIEAQGAPEFTPRFRANGSLAPLPNPHFDHGYFVRGTVGYLFGKYYAKASYETRYFKFLADPFNPNNLYNWRTNVISGGVGFSF